MHPLAESIQTRFPQGVVSVYEWRGDVAVTITREQVHDVCRYLRDDPNMDFDYMVHVSSVDWPDEAERWCGKCPRFGNVIEFGLKRGCLKMIVLWIR